jgi:hypothetical protein
MLLDKNRKYGNAALEPARVGGVDIPAETGILIRIGDKWKRWNNVAMGEDEDVVRDLIGYLILLRIARNAPSARPVKEPERIRVADLAEKLAVNGIDVLKKLSELGIHLQSVSETIDAEAAEVITAEFKGGTR